MKIDPRNPASVDDLVPSDLKLDGYYKTIVLLAIDGKECPVYFVVHGNFDWERRSDIKGSAEYWYEEHCCPHEFISVKQIVVDGDSDPHGIFEMVDVVWMTREYEEIFDDSEYLAEVFPQLRGNGDETVNTVSSPFLPFQ